MVVLVTKFVVVLVNAEQNVLVTNNAHVLAILIILAHATSSVLVLVILIIRVRVINSVLV